MEGNEYSIEEIIYLHGRKPSAIKGLIDDYGNNHLRIRGNPSARKGLEEVGGQPLHQFAGGFDWALRQRIDLRRDLLQLLLYLGILLDYLLNVLNSGSIRDRVLQVDERVLDLNHILRLYLRHGRQGVRD